MNKIFSVKTEKTFQNQLKKKTHEFNGLNREEKNSTEDSSNKDESEIVNINKLVKKVTKDNIINQKIKFILDKSNIKVTSMILSFLEFKDLLVLKSTNKYFRRLLSDKKIIREYALNGVLSPENRLIFYKTFININELKHNLINQFSSYEIKDKIYYKLLSLAKDLANKDEKFKNIQKQINKDINRTFYTDKFKYSNGKEMLDNILTIIAFIRPEIGYCQGMNFIVGALINFINNEETCFWIFLHFIDNIGLKDLYVQNMPDYLIKLYQLNYLIKENFPKMHHHLKTNRINLDIFFSKWILTIFSNFLDFETLYNIWDIFILDKWKVIFKVSIIICNYMKDDLIKMDLHSFSSYVRNNNLNSLKFQQLSKYYNKYKITNSKLNELKEDFYVEQLKTKLEIKDSGWDNNENYYINNYQTQLNNFINNLKRPVELLQIQITKLNLECEKATKKFEKKLLIVNELKSKIENEIESKTAYESTLTLLKSEIYPKEDNTNNIYHSNKNNIHIYGISNISGKKKIKKSETQYFSNKKNNNPFKIKNSKNIPNGYNKILKKLNMVNKEIQKDNKALLIACEKMDKKQEILERFTHKRDELKKQLDTILSTSELTKRELIKNLSNKLNSSP